MNFRLIGLFVLLISNISMAQNRGPAVEDFVGIEVEQVPSGPHESESLYNLERDITRIETKRKDGPLDVATPHAALENTGTNSKTIFSLAFILCLPIFSWMLVMNHLRKKAVLESASNLEVLEDYRKKKEGARNNDKDIKKAS